MAKFNARQSGPMRPSRLNRGIHPIWRGVGFALMILAPIVAWFSAELLLLENFRTGLVPIPQNLIIQWQDPYILVRLIVTAFITLVLYLIFTMVFFIIERIFGPSRYGPLDVPPVSYKGKSYKR